MNHRFVIIAPTFNAEKTCRQAILSLAAQSYANWHLIVIDDCSTDNTRYVICELMKTLGLQDNLTYISNTEKKWEIENTLIGLNCCDDEDIVCRVDMDDALSDIHAFEILNNVYNSNPILDVIWSNHRWISDDGVTNTNISGPMSQDVDPYRHPWCASHFKTFRKHVLNNVKDENYRDQNGNYFKRIGDQNFMLPALKNARQWMHIPICMYAYRCSQRQETFQSEDAKFQAFEALYLRNRGYIK